MYRTLAALLMAVVISISATPLQADVAGTKGGNGLVPFMSVDSTDVDGIVNFTIHNVEPNYLTYYFACSIQKNPIFWPAGGQGAYIVPNIFGGKGIMFKGSLNPLPLHVPQVVADFPLVFQVMVEDQGAKGGLAFSTDFEVTFSEDYNFSNFSMSLDKMVPHFGDVSNVAEHDGRIYFLSHPFGLGVMEKQTSGPAEPAGYIDVPLGTIEFRHITFTGDGKHAVLSNGYKKLWIVDLSDPCRPTFVSELYNYTYNLSHPVVVGDLVLAAAGSSGLALIDISNKTQPSILQTISYGANAYVTKVTPYKDDGVIVEVNSKDLCFYQVNGSNLKGLGIHSLAAYSKYCVHENGGTYLISKKGLTNTLETYNISNPANIILVDTEPVAFDIGMGMVIFDDRLYITDVDSGVHSYSIEIPADFKEYEFFPTPEKCVTLYADEDYLYLVGDSDWPGLHILDTSNSTIVSNEYNNSYSPLNDLAVGENGITAAICDSDTLFLVDETDPCSRLPRIMKKLDGYCNFIEHLSGDIFCVSYGSSRVFKTVRIDTSGQITVLGSCQTSSYAGDIYIHPSRSFAYALDGFCGLALIDISDPANPFLSGHFDDLGLVRDVQINENLAYMISANREIAAVDITVPFYPTLLGMAVSSSGTYCHIAHAGDHVYTIVDNSVLEIYDFTDVHHPKFTHSIDYYDDLAGIAATKNALFMTSQFDLVKKPDKCVYVLDLEDPEIPEVAHKYYNFKGNNGDLLIKNNQIHVLDSRSLIETIDITE